MRYIPVILLLALAQSAWPADSMQTPIPIALVAQPLGESLRILAKQANLQILFDSALVAGKSAPALNGNLSSRAALVALLRGTDLEAREQAPGVVVILGVERPWLMMVSTKSTDTARDAQFNEWYDKIDIPDVLQVPGYKRARRGLRVDLPQLPRSGAADDNTYVALYDILSPNIDRTIIDMLMASRKMEASGRSTDLLKVTERLYFRQVGLSSEATVQRRPEKKRFLLLERVDCCRDEATATQLNDWYVVRHIPDMLAIPGFVRATRYELYRVLMIEPRSAPHFLTVYEVRADSAEQAAALHHNAIHKLRQDGRLSDSFVEQGTALYSEINDVIAH